jgi:hypothetical protein
MRTLLFLLAIGFLLIIGIAAEPYQGPIYDAHAHISRKARPEKAVSDLLEAGFGRVVLFLEADRIEEAENVPRDKALIFSDPFTREKINLGRMRKKITYTFSEKRLANIEAAITNGKVAGFGEIYFHLSYAPFARDGLHTKVDADGVEDMFTVAETQKVPVHIHLEVDYASDLELLLETYPNVDIILAHCGYMRPEALSALMDRQPNLYAETSLIFNREIPKFADLPIENGTLRPEWEALLLRHADRILLGTDYAEFRSDQAPRILLYYRTLLGLLPKEKAEKIAYRNFNRIFVK